MRQSPRQRTRTRPAGMALPFTTMLGGKLLSIEKVPALVCRQCGEETFSADTVKRIEALLASGPTPSRVAEVPVYTLDAA